MISKTTAIVIGVAAVAYACSHGRGADKPAAPAPAAEPPGIDADALGLSKTNVFETPEPLLAKFVGGDPGENERSTGYFSGSPPVIPHQIVDFMPITMEENGCLDCHELPDEIGKEPAEGDARSMPASHFTDLRRDPGKVTRKVIGARYSCDQCHAPQADAAPLVANTYQP